MKSLLNITVDDESLPIQVNAPIQVIVEVKPCPPGFDLEDTICDCAHSIQGLATCNITNKAIKINGYRWIYPNNDSILMFEYCPFDYCNNEPFSTTNPNEQCV